MKRRGCGRERRVGSGQRRQRFPGDRQLGDVERLDRLEIADDRQDGLAAVADVGFGEDRLVLDVRIDAKAVVAGNVARGEDADYPRMATEEWGQVADGEPRVRVRRADRLQPERAGGDSVVAVAGLAR